MTIREDLERQLERENNQTGYFTTDDNPTFMNEVHGLSLDINGRDWRDADLIRLHTYRLSEEEDLYGSVFIHSSGAAVQLTMEKEGYHRIVGESGARERARTALESLTKRRLREVQIAA